MTSTRRSTAYQAILDADPDHAEAKGAVRQIAFLDARNRAAARRGRGAPMPRPTTSRPRSPRPTSQILSQDVAAAFDRLIALVRRTAGDERTSVRTRLIELFELFDPADPEVIAGRRKLANALY